MPEIMMQLTWLQSVKVDAVTVFHDTHTRGLALRVWPSGTKSWEVTYRLPGDRKKRFKGLGRFPAVSLKQARLEAARVLVEASEGEAPKESDVVYFAKLAKEYIDRYAKVINPATGEPRKRSWKKDEDAIKRDLLPYWEHRRAADIKKKDVVDVLDMIVERGSTIQANRTLALIRKIYNWGIERDLVEANPCAQIKAPSQENERERALSDVEIQAFWKACDKLNPIVAAAFRMRLVTAQRGREVDSMRWADIEGDWWTIPPAIAKNKQGHRVPLSPLAISILGEMKAMNDQRVKPSPWVFPSRMKKDAPLTNPHASARTMLEKVEAILEELGHAYQPFKPHDLRRTAASNMGELGIDEAMISRVLNHTAPAGGAAKVTRVYNRYAYDREKRAALEAWAERLTTIIELKPGERVAEPSEAPA